MSAGNEKPFSSLPDEERIRILGIMAEMINPDLRSDAMAKLTQMRDKSHELAIPLWHSVGTIAALLQEIMKFYSLYPDVGVQQCTDIINALVLLQFVASHRDTKKEMIDACIHDYLYPMLKIETNDTIYEFLKINTLQVFGNILKNCENEYVAKFLDTELIPLCFNIIENGTQLQQITATHIIYRLLVSESGLEYMCAVFERFSSIATMLGRLTESLSCLESSKLLALIIRSYLRLASHPLAHEALKNCLPDRLRDRTFSHFLEQDSQMRDDLDSLIQTLEPKPEKVVKLFSQLFK